MRQAGSVGPETPRRAYTHVSVAPAQGGFTVQLDGRGVKTPVGALLVAPTVALAQLLADEWVAQGGQIDAFTMPANRLAATAVDRIAGAGSAIAAEVARYAGSDVLCYHADGPDALVQAEREAWRPWLAWSAEALDAVLHETTGVAPVSQPMEALMRIESRVAALAPFPQAGVAYAAPLYGSAILALAVQAGVLDASRALEVSQVDEAFQAERWGLDEEAAARLTHRRREAALLGRWFDALRT